MAVQTHGKFDGLSERDRINLGKTTKWAVPFFLAYILAVVILGPVEGGLEATPFWRMALALLPLIPGFFTFNAYFKFTREADELLKRVLYEAAAKSFAIVIMLGFIYCLATQIFGEWEDSGAILWVIGLLLYQILFNRTWRKFSV